ncbi:MAG: hypothetical protein J5663_04245 [Bacteroidaceae bacterium]|nr:hypothetical protein [Bacteroidaceae bacterium]
MKLDKYPSIPEEMMAVFCDYCHPFLSGIAKVKDGGRGQYLGQLTPDSHIYGFGQYIADNDNSITGIFRMSTFIFGIKLGTHIAKVGSNSHYISYDLTTGEPLSIMKDGEVIPIPESARSVYKFQSLSYQSGDRYVGETVNGKREGYGLYHYKDGGFFYGRYHENEPYGYGAIFTTDARIKIMMY